MNMHSHFRAVGMSVNSLHESFDAPYMRAFFFEPSALPVEKISSPFLRDTRQCPYRGIGLSAEGRMGDPYMTLSKTVCPFRQKKPI